MGNYEKGGVRWDEGVGRSHLAGWVSESAETSRLVVN